MLKSILKYLYKIVKFTIWQPLQILQILDILHKENQNYK